MKAIIAVAAFAAFTGVTTRHATADAFVRWSSEHAVRIGWNAGPSADLRPVSAMIGNSRLVLLGEPVHGSHEPLAFRNRLFRELVTQAGFSAIALETSFPDATQMQTYIDGGPGTARDVARRGFTWRFGDFGENVELLEFMRAWNADPAHRTRLHIYGIDISGDDEMPNVERIERAIAAPVRWLRHNDSVGSAVIVSALMTRIERLRAVPHATMSAVDRDGLTGALADLGGEMERHRASTQAAADASQFQFALQCAVAAKQVDAFWRSMPPTDSTRKGIPPGVYRPMTSRDGAMADNVAWVFAQEQSRGRVFVFAHNTHVNDADIRGGISDQLAQPPAAMGAYLRIRFGRDAFVIAQVAAASRPGYSPAPLDSLGIEAALARVGSDHFVVNLRDAPSEGPVADWLTTPHSMRVNHNLFTLVRLRPAFDALVFVDSLSRFHPDTGCTSPRCRWP